MLIDPRDHIPSNREIADHLAEMAQFYRDHGSKALAHSLSVLATEYRALDNQPPIPTGESE